MAKENKREIRTVTAKIELRAVGDGDNQQEVIEGYALKFNTWSSELGFWVPFREKIMSEALNSCDMSDVKCLFNHDANQPLGRNTISSGIGSLVLSIDNIGLKFRCIPTNTSYGNDLKENIRAGVVNQCSFAFSIPDEEDADTIEYNETDNIYERTINKIETLYDVSPVTYPAYPDTEAVVGQRCKSKIEELRSKSKKEKRQSVGSCVCSSCNHSDNCQSSGAKCCICSNCDMVEQCSKPGANGCQCNICTMAENNCCQTGAENCLCSTCTNTDCMKGHPNNNSSNKEMNNNKLNDEQRKKLILKTYL